MTQHIRQKYLLIILVFFISCKKNTINTPEKKNLVQKHKNDNIIKTSLKETKIGKWTLTKSKKYGEWEKNIDYFYTKNQLKNNYKKITLEFTKDNIIIHELVCSGTNKLIKETLDFNLTGTDRDIKNTKYFFKETFHLLEKNFKGIYNLSCNPPFHKIFDFGNKLLIREYGTYYYLFEKKIKNDIQKSQDFNCKELEIKTTIYEEPMYKICSSNSNFKDTYLKFYRKLNSTDKKIFKKELPEKNDSLNIGDVSIVYKFHATDSIKINVTYSGGDNEYIFKKKGSKTIIEYYAFPP